MVGSRRAHGGKSFRASGVEYEGPQHRHRLPAPAIQGGELQF